MSLVDNDMKREVLVISLVTIYLIIYSIIAFLEINVNLVFILFAISPFLVIWMVISVLKSTGTTVEELKEGEEWGYQDKSKEQLGIFEYGFLSKMI
jgi:hypothetical protein